MQHLAPIPFIHMRCLCGSNLYHVTQESHYATAYKGIAKLYAGQEGNQFAIVKNNLAGEVSCPFCNTHFQLANDIVLQQINTNTG